MLSSINQASQMARTNFTDRVPKRQGFIEKGELATALSQISAKAEASTSSVDDVFTALDGNSDGKVTKDEFASVLAQLQEQMDSQRMQGGMQGAGGMPPPPPPGDDAGFTKDELTSQIESASRLYGAKQGRNAIGFHQLDIMESFPNEVSNAKGPPFDDPSAGASRRI